MNGQKGVVILIVAMLLTAGIGFFLNVSQKDVTKIAYNKITDLEGIIGENAGSVSSYSDYSPTSNITGWYGNSSVPLTEDGTASPYIISPRGVVYTPSTYTVNMRSFTYTTGTANYAGDPFSESTWSTNKAGVTYSSYPIVGDASANARDSWLKYSDGSTIHGGMSSVDGHSILGFGGYYRQGDKISYYVGDVSPTGAIMIFATVEEVLAKAGVTLQNNYRLAVTGDVLYNCNLYADKYYSGQTYDSNGKLRQMNTNTDIHLQGYKNTCSVINYMNGVYSGLDESGNSVWSSSNVYIYTIKSNITVTVGVPSISNPTYADAYKLSTIYDSEHTLDPVSHDFTFDWSAYPITENSIVQSQEYTIDNSISPYIADMENIPDTYGDLLATLSDGSSVSMDDDFLNLFGMGVWGFKPQRTNGEFAYTWNESSHEVKVKYAVPNTVSTAQGYVYYMFTGDLISKFVPNPIEGDIVSFDIVSGVNSAYMLYPDLSQPTTYSNYGALRFSKQYYTAFTEGTAYYPALASFDVEGTAYMQNSVQLESVYFKYVNGFWIPYNSSTSAQYSSFSESWDTETGAPPRIWHSYVRPGNLLAIYSQAENDVPILNLNMTYTRNTIQFATSDADVVFGDFTGLTLSNGEPLYGGVTTDWINLSSPVEGIEQIKLTYNISGERANLRWINLRSAVVGLDEDILLSAVNITFNGEPNTRLYQNLSMEFNITNPTPTQALYSITLIGTPIDCDFLHYNMAGYWVAYSGTNAVWSGQLSDLMIVSDSVMGIDFEIVTEGYVWTDNPTSDETVAYWSNGADNATIVNGRVSLLLVPNSSEQTDIQIYTGDVMWITAIPQGSGYNFTYTVGSSTPVTVGNYVGLYVTYNLSENTVTVAGLTSFTNTVAYAISPIVFDSTLINTDSLRFLYFEAFSSDWGAYVAQTYVENDPLGMLWGGFNVNLNNYLSTQLPGVRVAINGVVAYGTSLTINGVVLPVSDGKITFHDKQYVLKSSSIDYTADNHTYIRITEGSRTTLDLGETTSYVFAGEGSWYFATSAYAISTESSQEYQWTPGWELNWNQAIVVFIIVMVGACIVCRRLEMLDMDFMDWLVVIGAIIICGGLISSGGI